MRRLLLALAALALVPAALSQRAFQGTWKIDWSQTTIKAKPSQQVLKDGKYTCDPCGVDGAFTVPADGADHPVSGIKGSSSIAVEVVSDTEIHQTNKLDGKVVWSGDIKLQPDGRTRLVSWPEDNGARTVTVEDTRMAPGPPGAHALSGTWVLSKIPPMSDDDLVATYKVEGDQFIYSNTKKVVYRAKLNGPEVPLEGDPSGSTVSVKLVDPDTVEETWKKGDVLLTVSRMTVKKDGKTMNSTNTDANGVSMEMVALKQ